MKIPRNYINPDDVGHWDGDTFVFDPPLTIGGHTMERLDFSNFQPEDPSISKQEALEAVVNGFGFTVEEEQP